MKRFILMLVAVVVAAVVVSAQVPPARGVPPPQMPTVPAPVPPAMTAAQMAPSTPSTDVLLLAALRVQDAKIAELEARIVALEKRAGVKR